MSGFDLLPGTQDGIHEEDLPFLSRNISGICHFTIPGT
jgi:hypothetical protein